MNGDYGWVDGLFRIPPGQLLFMPSDRVWEDARLQMYDVSRLVSLDEECLQTYNAYK